ncbi:MAG: hypothetical protein EBR72_09825, partial [Bacteroidetes bacterium]|nr:hypothetical protein [Bacteroidota bacterium]
FGNLNNSSFFDDCPQLVPQFQILSESSEHFPALRIKMICLFNSGIIKLSARANRAFCWGS